MTAPVPVPPSELVSLAAWQSMRPLAGPEHLVRDIESLEIAADVGYLPERPGTIVASMTAFEDDDIALDIWLRRLAACDAAALLLPRTAPLLTTTRDLAARLRIPVLGGPDLLTVAVGVRAWLAEPATELAAALSDLCAQGHGTRTPQDLVAEVRSALHLDVAVLTGAGRVVAGAALGTTDLVTDVARVQQVRCGSDRSVFVPVTDGERTQPVAWVGARVPERMAARMRIAVPVLRLAAIIMRSLVAEDRGDLERDARTRSAVLAEIQRRPDQPSASVTARAADLGWRLDGWHVGFRVGVLDEDPDWFSATVELTRCIEAGGLTAEVLLEQDGWICWVSEPDEPSTERMHTLVGGVRAAQRMLSSRLASYMGVGSAHHGPAGLVRTLSESRDAAQLAMARKESGRFLHLGRLGTAQLLLAWTGTELFQPAAQALLEPLQDQAGDLVPTLVAYLDSESNLSEAAAVLGVHRNTVASRIQRVEQLLDVSLKDADERLALHLAARTALRRSADPS